MNKTFEKWLARAKDHDTPWTENEIAYFRKAVGLSGLRCPILRNQLLQEFSGPYRITQEQSEKGRNYLLSKSLKQNGKPRKRNKLGTRELDILRNLSHHVLVDLHQPQPHLEYYLPIYRAIAHDGDSFDYIGTAYDFMEVVA